MPLLQLVISLDSSVPKFFMTYHSSTTNLTEIITFSACFQMSLDAWLSCKLTHCQCLGCPSLPSKSLPRERTAHGNPLSHLRASISHTLLTSPDTTTQQKHKHMVSLLVSPLQILAGSGYDTRPLCVPLVIQIRTIIKLEYKFKPFERKFKPFKCKFEPFECKFEPFKCKFKPFEYVTYG